MSTSPPESVLMDDDKADGATKHSNPASERPSLERNLSGDAKKNDEAHGNTNTEAPSSSADDLDYDPDTFEVRFRPGDPDNPRNWSGGYKAWITAQLGMLAACGSCASSIVAPAEPTLSKEFGVSLEVTVLVVSLYVLGFAFGPCFWAPIAETYGRKVSMLPAFFALALFNVGTGLSQNAAALFLTRFFAGVFGSAPISNVSASLGDMYEPKARGIAVTFYALAVSGGPTIGPVIGSALLVNPALGWRWIGYIMGIWCAFILVLAIFFIPEMYAPVLLKRKAVRMRKRTGDDRYWHPHESARIELRTVVTKHLSRPIHMFCTEPMLAAIGIYASFVYGLLYMTLEVLPIVFSEIRGYGTVVATLPFLSIFVGILAAVFVNLANNPRYGRAVEANRGRAVPEARLPPMIVGGVLFVIGIFWFGWTGAAKYPWPLPVVAIGFIGAGFNIIFQQCINFLVDTYAVYAASAVSANTIVRSIFACALPLVARPMFLNLGVGPACSILGGIAVLLLPVPFLFMKYGLRLRKMSKYAPVNED